MWDSLLFYKLIQYQSTVQSLNYFENDNDTKSALPRVELQASSDKPIELHKNRISQTDSHVCGNKTVSLNMINQ